MEERVKDIIKQQEKSAFEAASRNRLASEEEREAAVKALDQAKVQLEILFEKDVK